MENQNSQKTIDALAKEYNELQRRTVAFDPASPACSGLEVETVLDLMHQAGRMMLRMFELVEDMQQVTSAILRNRDELIKGIEERGYYTRDDVAVLRAAGYGPRTFINA